MLAPERIMPGVLAKCLLHVGHLAAGEAAVAELDPNPIVITDNRAVAVDVLVHTNLSFVFGV